MKKMAILVVMALIFSCFLTFSVSVSAKEVPITEENLALLKGKWEGRLNYGGFKKADVPVVLEIINDTIPLKGKITLSFPAAGVAEVPFENGIIEKGKFLVKYEDGKPWIKLRLDVKGEKIELLGDYSGKSGGGFLWLYEKINP